MTDADRKPLSNMLLSHIEIYVQDIAAMETFYTQCLGFVVTDRGAGKDGMVFLSRHPNEHHQIVLNPQQTGHHYLSPIDHISFRVESINDLRNYYCALLSSPEINIQTVSHGTTWSIYFRDPQGNRFEIFTDTPWHVNQPCKFTINLALSDDELILFTQATIENMPGYSSATLWKAEHQNTLT